MAVIIVILVIVGIIAVFRLGKNTGEAIMSSSNGGGMRIKYAKLLELILSGHKDSKVFVETKTYLRAGVSNYGGSTIFHIQQCPGNLVMIEYEVSNNPSVKDFTLKFSFDDRMDQEEMMAQMAKALQEKMM